MMDHTYRGNDGQDKTLRRFLDGKSLGPAVTAAVRDPATKKVEVTKVGRNERCPCGSGEKFKKCCLWKVNCGVEIISESDESTVAGR